MVFSSSSYLSLRTFGHPAYWLENQFSWLLIAVICMLPAVFIDYRMLLSLWPVLFGATVAGLVFVFVPGIGKEVNDSSRWLHIAGLNAQPSELAKLTVIVCIAGFLSGRRDVLNRFRKTFLPLVGGLLLIFGLIILEPDLGTSVYVLALGIILMLVSGVRMVYLSFAGMIASPALAFFVWMKWEKILNRLGGLFDFSETTSYQIRHSVNALGSGGLWGRGLGCSMEKLGFLPEPQTDFIFSVLGEEFGYAGTVVVLFLLAVFLFSGFQVARKAHDFGGFLLAFGAVFSLIFQSVFNIAVVSKSAPTKGISLPFISYGGSGLVLALIEVGLIMNVARIAASEGQAADFRGDWREEEEEEAADPEEHTEAGSEAAGEGDAEAFEAAVEADEELNEDDDGEADGEEETDEKIEEDEEAEDDEEIEDDEKIEGDEGEEDDEEIEPDEEAEWEEEAEEDEEAEWDDAFDDETDDATDGEDVMEDDYEEEERDL